MIITKYEDMQYSLRVRHELSLYYWGRGCIIEFREWPIYYLKATETLIVSICNGIYTVNDIIMMIEQKTEMRKELIIEIINDLLRNRILLLRKEKKEYKPTIWGEFGMFYPKDITFELTNRCNYKCNFCYKNAKQNGVYLHESVIDEFMEVLKGKLQSILLTGGEPLLHPDFENILCKLAPLAEVRMVSNGSLFWKLSHNVVEKLHSLQLSLYGTSAEEYSKITGNARGLKNIKDSLKLAKECNVPTRLSAVLNEKTIDNMEKYVVTAIELGAERLNLDTAYLFGRELKGYSGSEDYKKKVEEFYFKELDCVKKYHTDIEITMRTVNVFSWKGRYKLDGYDGLNCGGGSRKLVVSQNGKIRACECFPEDLFDYGGIDILKKMIYGDFQITKLCDGMKEFYKLNKTKIQETEICTSLTDFCHRKEIVI